MPKVKMHAATIQRKFRRKRRLAGTHSFTKINEYRRTALLASLILLQGLVVVSSIECRLELSPVKVTFDLMESEYDGMTEAGDENNINEKDDVDNRNLRAVNKEIIKSLMSQSERPREIKWKLLDGSETSLETTNSSMRREVLVRRCLCDEVSDNTFCPVDKNANACSVSSDSSDTLCYRTSQRSILIKKIWPIVIVWYGAMFLFLVATAHGRNVRNFIMSKIFSDWNDETIDRIVRRETAVRNMLRSNYRMNRVGDESDDRYDPNQRRFLVLRTKRYCSAKCTTEKFFISNLNGGTVDSDYPTPDSKYEHTDESERVTTKSETITPCHLTKPMKGNSAKEFGLDENGERTPTQRLQTPMIVNSSFSEDFSLASALSPSSRLCFPDSFRTNPDETDPMHSVDTPNDKSTPKKSDGLSISDSSSLADNGSSNFCPPFEVHSDLQTRKCEDVEKVEYDSNHGVRDDGEDKGFNSENDVCDDDCYNDKLVCTICIMEVKDGDRIGALPCDHNFHVDCLKEWIKRKNVCPLCQEPNIASIRREPNTSTESVVDNINADDADNTDPRASSTDRQALRVPVQTSLFSTILTRTDSMQM